MKRVLVTGSTSTVGRAIGAVLAREYHVSYGGRRAADIMLDLSAPQLELPAGVAFDVLVHAAADFGGHEEAQMRRAEQVNVIGTLNVCALAHRAGVKLLVLISSISAGYGPNQAYFDIYALSKRHAEELAELYCAKHGLGLVILRPSALYDAATHCRTHQRLLYALIDQARRDEDFVFNGSHDALRNYVFLDDFAETVARVVQHRLIGKFDCAAIEPVRLSEICRTANHVFGGSGQLRFTRQGPDIADVAPPSGLSVYESIGYYPATSLLEGMQCIRQVIGGSA